MATDLSSTEFAPEPFTEFHVPLWFRMFILIREKKMSNPNSPKPLRKNTWRSDFRWWSKYMPYKASLINCLGGAGEQIGTYKVNRGYNPYKWRYRTPTYNWPGPTLCISLTKQKCRLDAMKYAPIKRLFLAGQMTKMTPKGM